MKLIDHVNAGNEMKDCLGTLSTLKPKVTGRLGQDCRARRLINKAITEINELRVNLNEVLIKDYPDVSSANLVYFGTERSILIKTEVTKKEVLLPIPKEELARKKKKAAKV